MSDNDTYQTEKIASRYGAARPVYMKRGSSGLYTLLALSAVLAIAGIVLSIFSDTATAPGADEEKESEMWTQTHDGHEYVMWFKKEGPRPVGNFIHSPGCSCKWSQPRVNR